MNLLPLPSKSIRGYAVAGFLAVLTQSALLNAQIAPLGCAASSSPAVMLRADGSPPYWMDLKPGRYAVGYELRYISDPTRTFVPDSIARGQTRPTAPWGSRWIPLRIFFPAAATTRVGHHLRYGAYIDSAATAGTTPPIANVVAERSRDILSYAVRHYTSLAHTPFSLADTLGVAATIRCLPAMAKSHVKSYASRFPLVVFAGGASHSSDENVILWEYLASHGYVIATLPSIGTGEGDISAYPRGIETMARDLEAIIAVMQREPYVDTTRVNAMGFSIGGAAALIAGIRDDRIRSVTGLDPSFIANQFVGPIRTNPSFIPGRFPAPLLELHRSDTTVTAAVLSDLSRSARYSAEFDGLDHVDFNSYSNVLLYVLHGRENQSSTATTRARDSAVTYKAAAYRGIVRSVLRFLDKANGAATIASCQAIFGTGASWLGVSSSAVRFSWHPSSGIVAGVANALPIGCEAFSKTVPGQQSAPQSLLPPGEQLAAMHT